jgi:hypothetical protein
VTFEDDLLALERRVLEEAGGDFFRAVADLRRMLAGEAPGIPAKLAALAVPALEEAARRGTLDGWSLGGQRAITAAGTARRVEPNALHDADLRLLTPPAHLTDPFTGLDALMVDAKARTVALVRTGADPMTAAAPILQAATTARSRIITQVNAASNAAAIEVGDATRSPMVWEAERDACVYCLALAGEVVDAGDTFPKADLYAPAPTSMATVDAPPLHPNCRCRLAVLVERSYADALKREAQRSILRGHSLASESEAVRVRAAARLLERDPVAPKSVKAYAAKAVKAGRFPTRDTPQGDPRLIIERGGPPKPPTPPEPPKLPERPADIRTRIGSATSATEVADHLRDHLPKTELIGWDPKTTTVEAARQIATTVVDLVEKFPKVNIEGLRIEPLKTGVLAHAEAFYVRPGNTLRGVSLVVNSKHIGDDAARADFVRPSIAHGFFHSHEAEESLVYTMTHEFGHAVDYTTGQKTRRQVASIQARYAKESGIPKTSPLWGLNLSGYSRQNSGELIAEAFADVELNGDKAKGLSKAIHAALIKNLEEA